MGVVRSAAKWGARGVALKFFAPIIGLFAVMLTVLGLVMAVILLGGEPDGDVEAFTGNNCRAVTVSGGGQPVASGKIPEKAWEEEVIKASKDSGVPSAVLAAQIEKESGWNPKARSSAGAVGLTQFIPSTWEMYGNGADPEDPIASIQAQGRYMKALKAEMQDLARESGISDIDLALAGYNAGSGAVFAHGGIPPYEETQNYVARINEMRKAYEAEGIGQDGRGEDDAETVADADTGDGPVVELAAETVPEGNAHIENGTQLQQDAYQLARAIQSQFGEVNTIGGWRPTDAIAQDHPEGRAVDIMIPDYSSDSGRRLGEEINAYVWKNRDRFNVEYTIWRQELFTNGADSGSGMEDRGSDTQNHFDHVHVTVVGGGPNDGKAGEIPERDGEGTVSVADANREGQEECEPGAQAVSYSGGSTSGNDDYPWKGVPGGVNVKSEFYYGQCTDFAWWRLNQQMGGDENNIVIKNTSFPPRLSHGGLWDEGWRNKGWPVDKTPEVGAMAVFKPGVSGADPVYGHIAVVKEIKDGEDTVVIEEYNAMVPLGYGVRELPVDGVSWYLHIPDSEKKAERGGAEKKEQDS